MIRTNRYPTGRKHCSCCGCWRPLMEFPERGNGLLHSWCQACHRLSRRERGGFKPRSYTHCKRGHRFTPENTYRNAGRRFCRICQRQRQAKWRRDPVVSVQRREYNRIWKEGQRRAQGAPVRLAGRRIPQDYHERLLLPGEPFAEWLRENVPTSNRMRWAVANGIDETQVRRLLNGEQETVHIDTVDRVVDPGVLNELYPIEPEVVAA